MIKNKIKLLKIKLKHNNIDGYIIPKNDEFFSEYVFHDRLKSISGFSGSAGLAIILEKENYLFVDGRYTIQAKQQAGKFFKIIEIHKFLPRKLLKNLKLGYDPRLFTKSNLDIYFGNSLKLKSISSRLSELVKLKYVNRTSTTNSVQYSITTQGIYWLSSVLSKKIF